MKRHSVTVLLDELSLFFIDQAVHLAMAQSAKNDFLFITFMGNSVFFISQSWYKGSALEDAYCSRQIHSSL